MWLCACTLLNNTFLILPQQHHLWFVHWRLHQGGPHVRDADVVGRAAHWVLYGKTKPTGSHQGATVSLRGNVENIASINEQLGSSSSQWAQRKTRVGGHSLWEHVGQPDNRENLTGLQRGLWSQDYYSLLYCNYTCVQFFLVWLKNWRTKDRDAVKINFSI